MVGGGGWALPPSPSPSLLSQVSVGVGWGGGGGSPYYEQELQIGNSVMWFYVCRVDIY